MTHAVLAGVVAVSGNAARPMEEDHPSLPIPQLHSCQVWIMRTDPSPVGK